MNELEGKLGKQMEETNRVLKDEGILNNIYLDGICQTLGLYNMALAGCAHIWEL